MRMKKLGCLFVPFSFFFFICQIIFLIPFSPSVCLSSCMFLSSFLPVSLSPCLSPHLSQYGEQMFRFSVSAGCCNDRLSPHVHHVVYRGFTPLVPAPPWGNVLTWVVPKYQTGVRKVVGCDLAS